MELHDAPARGALPAQLVALGAEHQRREHAEQQDTEGDEDDARPERAARQLERIDLRSLRLENLLQKAQGRAPRVFSSARAVSDSSDRSTELAADRTLPSALFRIVAPEQLLPLMRNGGAL